MNAYPTRYLPNPGQLTHGENSLNSAEYRSWAAMKSRCYNPKNKSYPRYGGRGIVVCARWLHSYENFLEDMGRRPNSKMSLERKKTNEGYSLNNCVWANAKSQARNRTNNKRVIFRGEELTMAELIERYYPGEDIDVVRSRISQRQKYGWSFERSLFDAKVPNTAVQGVPLDITVA